MWRSKFYRSKNKSPNFSRSKYCRSKIFDQNIVGQQNFRSKMSQCLLQQFCVSSCVFRRIEVCYGKGLEFFSLPRKIMSFVGSNWVEIFGFRPAESKFKDFSKAFLRNSEVCQFVSLSCLSIFSVKYISTKRVLEITCF